MCDLICALFKICGTPLKAAPDGAQVSPAIAERMLLQKKRKEEILYDLINETNPYSLWKI